MNEEERQRLNRQLQEQMNKVNNQPNPDMEGLTPLQMHRLLRYPLAKESWFGLRSDLSDETILRMPMMKVLVTLLDRIAKQKEMKLTQTGNLPRKLVQELYSMFSVDKPSKWGFRLPLSENDWGIIMETHFIIKDLGWCKKRNNKISLTAAGKKILTKSHAELFEAFLKFQLFKVNIGWNDGYPDSPGMQACLPYSLFLLYKYGRELHFDHFYSSAFLRAFPSILEEFPGHQYSSPKKQFDRAFYIRLLYLFNTYDWINILPNKGLLDPEQLTATDLFFEIFEQRSFEELPTPEDHIEREIQTALFDAEMGGISYVANDIPLELMNEFHEHIRQFHASDAHKKEVAINELLPVGFLIVPPEEITDEAIAIRETERILTALDAANIVTDAPEDLSAQAYYTFLHDVILPTKVIPFGGKAKTFLPYEDFLEDDFLEEELAPEIQAAENFLLSLLFLDEPFPLAILANQVRLGSEMVDRAVAFEFINNWRAQFKEIVPISFAPGYIETDETGGIFPLFHIVYKTLDKAGNETEHSDKGVVQLQLIEGKYLIQGAQIPGFAL
jgi:hypothetical protein